MNNGNMQDRRLLEALDYIDPRFIAEVTDSYEVSDRPGEYGMPKKAKRRYYTKVAMLAACVVLFAGFIMALPKMLHDIIYPEPGGTVVTEDPVEDMLTEEDLVMINEFFSAAHLDPNYVWAESVEEAMEHPEYRGKYGECIVFFTSTEYTDEYTFIVGNYRFYTRGYTVLYDGKGHHLLDAYLDGMLNDAHIARICGYNMLIDPSESSAYIDKSLYISQTTLPISLSAEEIDSIMRAYFKWNRSLSPSYTNDTIFNIRCFGKFDGMYAVIVDEFQDLLITENDGYTMTISGVDFIDPYSGRLLIYKDGEICGFIHQAFESGLIDQAQLEQLAEYFNDNIALYPPKLPQYEFGAYAAFELGKITVALMPFADASEYNAADFSEIGCIDVELLSDEMFIDTNGKNSAVILELTLAGKNRQDVIEAVKVLRMRSDIYTVKPKYILLMSEQDFIAAYINDTCEYYGKYGNCYITYPLTGNDTNITEQIGKYTFEYSGSTGIQVFYIDRFYSLTEAYENDFLSDESLPDIYNYHTGAKNIKLSDDGDTGYIAKLIAFAYAKEKGIPFADKSFTVNIMYRSAYEVYAAFITSEGENITTGTWSETANNYEYKYKDGRRLYIISGGRVMTLNEAEAHISPSDDIWTSIYFALLN